MNKLKQEKQEIVLSLLVEGNSIRSVERITGVHRDTIMRLILNATKKAKTILINKMRDLNPKNIQVDEIWCFVGKKQKQLTKVEKRKRELGDQYVFVALDADTKIVPTLHVGKRTTKDYHIFISDLADRIDSRYQLSSDASPAYFDVIDEIYGTQIDYGQIHKIYSDEVKTEKRYSPPIIIETIIKKLLCNPLIKNISTSFVERQNLTIRMQLRRFTRLTNAFSKKLEDLKAALALHFYHHNFMSIHQTLRMPPAMEARLTNHIWTWEELINYRSV